MGDLINGLFELIGGLVIWINVWKIHKDKIVRGVHWGPMVFFTSWGLWNLYYYPSLSQWWSLAGATTIAVANVIYTVQMVYYTIKEKITRSQSS